MGCAVQNVQMEKFLKKENNITENKVSVNKLKARKRHNAAKQAGGLHKLSEGEINGAKPKRCILPVNPEKGTNMKVKNNPSKMEETSIEKTKKKNKWKKMSLTDTGFTISLFPRPTHSNEFDSNVDFDNVDVVFNTIECDLDKYTTILEKYDDLEHSVCDVMEGTVKQNVKYGRKDRHRKVRKAGRQVKDKHCLSVKNNNGRKKLYIHHRLFKLINLEDKRLSYIMPSRTYTTSNIFTNKSTNETRSKLKAPGNVKAAPAQNLRHTLHATNAPSDIDSQILSGLINLQHRELTPEDYEMLLQLDESVAPKTIAKSTLEQFKTDTVTDATSEDICAVCMEMYEVGQNRKFLPCNHVFHAKCIDMWLENSSMNCPVDGLPVNDS